MSDLDPALRAAVAEAAAATVAPPFAAVVRRARVRLHRQVAAVAAGAVAVAGAAALAVPGRLPRGQEPLSPTTTTAPDGCTAQYGNDGVPIAVCVPSPGRDGGGPCEVTPAPGGGTTTIRSGTVRALHWYVLAWTSQGTQCVGYTTRPRDEPLTPSDYQDSGPVDDPRPLLTWDLLDNRTATTALIFWGAVPPEVVRVEWLVGDEKQSFPTYAGGERRYVATVLVFPDGTGVERQPVGYDAEGRPVDLPAIRP